ncbi:MBL fold metallo-hydrolase [Candidatus Albibeggiatoa sp. nov. NOAA]|uniref:MBL fold metallo-hydrolase n=1 Tax=Candidatus Albibeggiatoa sp. nov. NOAA TaxID=3162724 RepID=UPI0033007DF5|nr:MBL fold metallo-hydrolase [Thiotrichaceae bacterium]
MTTYIQDHDFGISTIDTGFLRAGLASSHLIIQNQHAALIDVATSLCVPRIQEALQSKQIAAENVDYVIVTHVHLDHAGGAGQLMQLFPNAKLVVHPRGGRHMVDPSRLVAGAKAVYGDEVFARDYGEILPIDQERVIEADDGFTLDFQGRELTFVDTPGHAKHHFCVYDEMSSSFFTGDTFGIAYQDFITEKGRLLFASTTPVQFDPEGMKDSIQRMLDHNPKHMYLTHFGQVSDVPEMAEYLLKTLDKQVELMQQHANAGAERHNLLKEALTQYFLSELKTMGCTVPEAECRELLAVDIELNAQGLAVWHDKA